MNLEKKITFEDTNLSNAFFDFKDIKTILARGLNTAQIYSNDKKSLKNLKIVSNPTEVVLARFTRFT